MYQLLKYLPDRIETLGEYADLKPFCSLIPRMCPTIDSLYMRETVIRDVEQALSEVNSYMSVDEFVDTYKDSLSIATFENFSYAIQSGERMLLMTGDYENLAIEEINVIFRFCHRDIKYHGTLRPKYKVINMRIVEEDGNGGK